MKEWSPYRVLYEWVTLEISPGVPCTYPFPIKGVFGDRYSKPALYRWLFLGRDRAPVAAYIGEAENLCERLKGYMWPGQSQQTNLRMKAEFLKHIEAGGTVELQMLKFEPFAINNVNVFHESQLANPHIRKMFENLLIADHDSVHCELKNCSDNPIERRRRKSARARAVQAGGG